jgi:hypothetical protein
VLPLLLAAEVLLLLLLLLPLLDLPWVVVERSVEGVLGNF